MEFSQIMPLSLNSSGIFLCLFRMLELTKGTKIKGQKE